MKGSSVTTAQIERCKGSKRHQLFITEVEKEPTFGHAVWEMCEICTTVRVSIYDRLGGVASRYYKHPLDYDKVEITSAQYRLKQIKEFRKQQRENNAQAKQRS